MGGITSHYENENPNEMPPLSQQSPNQNTQPPQHWWQTAWRDYNPHSWLGHCEMHRLEKAIWPQNVTQTQQPYFCTQRGGRTGPHRSHYTCAHSSMHSNQEHGKPPSLVAEWKVKCVSHYFIYQLRISTNAICTCDILLLGNEEQWVTRTCYSLDEPYRTLIKRSHHKWLLRVVYDWFI